jgi:hypothetical protein
MQDQEILDNEVEEVVTQDNDPNEEQQQVDENQAQVEETSETKQDRNWRAMEQRQKELELALQQRDAVLDRFLKQPQQVQTQIEEEPDDPDDDFIPAGKVKKIASKQVKPLEQKIDQLEKMIAQQEQTKNLNSFKSQNSDFDDVVNVETLELLEKTDPVLAKDLMTKSPDQIGILSYKYIKLYGLADNLPNTRRKKEIDKKLEKNSKTIQSPTAYEKRPVAQAMKSTAADKKRLYEEMMYYASQASGL